MIIRLKSKTKFIMDKALKSCGLLVLAEDGTYLPAVGVTLVEVVIPKSPAFHMDIHVNPLADLLPHSSGVSLLDFVLSKWQAQPIITMAKGIKYQRLNGVELIDSTTIKTPIHGFA